MENDAKDTPEFEYDVAVSFAGENRRIVEEFSNRLQSEGVSVFYDAWEQPALWGKDLHLHLDEVYRRKARFCIIFCSEAYVRRAWTKHELRSAQARAFRENAEYILPVRLDDTDIPGLTETIAFVDFRESSTEQLINLTLGKLGMSKKDPQGKSRQETPGGAPPRDRTQIDREDWEKLLTTLSEELAPKVVEIAQLPRYIASVRKPNVEAGIKALCHGVSPEDARHLDNSDNFDTFIAMLDEFQRDFLRRIRAIDDPRREDVRREFYRSVAAIWNRSGRKAWVCTLFCLSTISWIACCYGLYHNGALAIFSGIAGLIFAISGNWLLWWR